MPTDQSPDPTPRRTSPRRATIRRRSDETFISLDNPDDGELFDTGDASDFSGESPHKYRLVNKSQDHSQRRSANISRRRPKLY